MNTEQRLTQLETRLDSLQQAFLQAQRNAVPTTDKVYDTASKVTEITPTTFTKTAYIDDTECTFYGVPEGNVSVFMDGQICNCKTNRIQNRLTVEFEALTESTEITINII